MGPPRQPARLVLVFDGDCSLCRSLARLLVRPALTGATSRRPFDAFEGDVAARLLAAGIHNEMAVLDEVSGEIRTGYAGILRVLGEGTLGWLARLLSLPGLRALGRALYRTVAYNRRVLAPTPPRAVACACDPDEHAGFRGLFLLASLALTTSCALLLAAGLRRWSVEDTTRLPGVAWPLWFAGAWLLTSLLARGRAPAGRPLLPWCHAAWTQALGCVPLAALGLALLLLRGAGGSIAITVAVGATLWITARANRGRLGALGVPATLVVSSLFGPPVLGLLLAFLVEG
jgi:predicted DCC family thiol-disulfide oxidoreductase YuxK